MTVPMLNTEVQERGLIAPRGVLKGDLISLLTTADDDVQHAARTPLMPTSAQVEVIATMATAKQLQVPKHIIWDRIAAEEWIRRHT